MNTEESRRQFEVWCKQRGYIERYYFFRQSHPNHYDDDQIEEMWMAWQAGKAQAVPEGWKLVPVAPNHSMRRAMVQAINTSIPVMAMIETIYNAGIAAAPVKDGE